MEQEQLKDWELKCVECGRLFLFEKGEQEFYCDKKLDPPRRCQRCRFLKRLQLAELEAHRG